MTDDEAKAELLRRQALADAAEARAQAEADRPAREAAEDEAMVERWRARHEQTPRPVRRAPEPPQRPVGPPTPDRLQRPRHGPDGRIRSIETYDSEFKVAQVLGWEGWVRETVANAQAETRRALVKQINDALEDFAGTLGGEISKDRKVERERAAGLLAEESGQLRTLIERQAAQIEQMARRIEQLEARAAPPPRLVAGESDAAD